MGLESILFDSPKNRHSGNKDDLSQLNAALRSEGLVRSQDEIFKLGFHCKL